MFHRRLALLFSLMLLAALVLTLKLAHLTVVRGSDLRDSAESVLVTRHFLPTVRGEILDREGRLLAIDRPCHDVELTYTLIGGEWPVKMARREVYRRDRKAWQKMSESERQMAIEPVIRTYEEQMEQAYASISRHTQISIDELILRRDTIRERVRRVKMSVWRNAIAEAQAESEEPLNADDVEQPRVSEESGSHILVAGLDDEVAMRLKIELMEIGVVSDEIFVLESKTRAYPMETLDVELDMSYLPKQIREKRTTTMRVRGVATHIIGSLRDVWAEDHQQRPFLIPGGEIDLGGYRAGDQIGRNGIEHAEEERLRGDRGQKITHLDTRSEERENAIPGKPVQLTLDIMLQAKIQGIMDPDFGLMKIQPWHPQGKLPMGTRLNGSAVVIEVESGDVLALVSTPGYTREDLKRRGGEIASDPDQPMVNRPLSAIYPPASTVKPLVYAMAVHTGHLSPDEVIDCRGHLFPDKPNQFRDWGWRPEKGLFLELGPLDPAGAIKHSTNYYFYKCGLRMGPRQMVQEYHRWGVGQRLDLGISESNAGILPRLDVMRNVRGRELNQSNGIFLAIGQGPIAVPPIQIANAHTALARHGIWKTPVLINHRRDRQEIRDLKISPQVWETAMRGMEMAVNDRNGTGHHLPGREPIFNIPGLTIRGKTGTAQAPLQWEDTNNNGRYDKEDRVVRHGNHGWFVAHVSKAGVKDVQYVILVMVEYGQSGGRAAGPVVNQILHAMRSEGYF